MASSRVLVAVVLAGCSAGKGGEDGPGEAVSCEAVDSFPLDSADPSASPVTLAGVERLKEIAGTTTWSVTCDDGSPEATVTIDAPGPASADYVVYRYRSESCDADEKALAENLTITIAGESPLQPGPRAAVWEATDEGGVLVSTHDDGGDLGLRIWPSEGGGWEAHTYLDDDTKCDLALVPSGTP